MRIDNNIQSLNVNKNQEVNQTQAESRLRKQDNNRIEEESASISINEQVRSELTPIRDVQQTQETSLSALQTADQGLQQINNLLVRASELTATQQESNNVEEVENVDRELRNTYNEIENIEQNFSFGEDRLFTGEATFKLNDVENERTEDIVYPNTSITGPESQVNITQPEDLRDTQRVEQAINQVFERRNEVGAYQDRIEANLRDFQEQEVVTQQVEQRIESREVASNETELASTNIRQEAQQALAVQANQLPQLVQSLLQ